MFTKHKFSPNLELCNLDKGSCSLLIAVADIYPHITIASSAIMLVFWQSLCSPLGVSQFQHASSCRFFLVQAELSPGYFMYWQVEGNNSFWGDRALEWGLLLLFILQVTHKKYGWADSICRPLLQLQEGSLCCLQPFLHRSQLSDFR